MMSPKNVSAKTSNDKTNEMRFPVGVISVALVRSPTVRTVVLFVRLDADRPLALGVCRAFPDGDPLLPLGAVLGRFVRSRSVRRVVIKETSSSPYVLCHQRSEIKTALLVT